MAMRAPLRRVLLRRLAIQSSYVRPSAFAAIFGFLACGMIVAALTHFSAMPWRRMSIVVVIVRPPRSRMGHVSASSPQIRRVSSSRTR